MAPFITAESQELLHKQSVSYCIFSSSTFACPVSNSGAGFKFHARSYL